MASPLGFTTLGWAPCMTIPLVIGVNPLQTTRLERGIVSGRVALLLRSAEIHPLFERFVNDGLFHYSSSPLLSLLNLSLSLYPLLPIQSPPFFHSLVKLLLLGVVAPFHCGKNLRRIPESSMVVFCCQDFATGYPYMV